MTETERILREIQEQVRELMATMEPGPSPGDIQALLPEHMELTAMHVEDDVLRLEIYVTNPGYVLINLTINPEESP